MRSFYSLCFANLLRCGVCLLAPGLFAVSAYGAASAATSAGPTATGSISGTVADPTGAVIPQATVTVMHVGGGTPVKTTISDGVGHFSLVGLPPGVYVIEAQEAGFHAAHQEDVRVAAGSVMSLTLTLAIESDQQSVTVSANALDASPEKNGSAITLSSDDLRALSDDPDEMQTQLQAIAGADAETGSQFYVDGFTANKLPPKAAIKEIRINQNPYSAQYDSLGYGRIEIITKPGADKAHAEYWMQGNNSPWNAMNPFVTSQPPYYSWQLWSDVNGPVTKNSSYFFTIWTQKQINDSIVNAEILDDSLNQTAFTQAVSNPSSNLEVSPRFDWQIGKVHTISLRYQLARNTATNSGVGQFELASQGYNTNNVEQVVQFRDMQAWSPHVLNEVRFQYTRDRNNQTPQSLDPTLVVQGGFTGGGSNTGINRDAQDHYEFQDLLRIDVGTHDINVGGRLRGVRDSNFSTANYNGQYTFGTLDAYQITEQGIQQGLTPAQIRANGGGASQYAQTTGTPGIVVGMVDAGIYAEDNWKITPNVTFSYGLRFETQDDIHDHADYGPRIGLAWSIPGGKNKPPHAVIRTGYGIFYQRFTSAGLLQAQRQNGVNQSEVVVSNPDFYPETCTTNPTACAQGMLSGNAPTIYSINSSLRAPYLMIAGLGVDKPIGKHISLSANYLYSEGVHLFITRNINAPLPGTYNINDPSSGERPLGVFENVYQYGSEGASSRNRFMLNGSYRTKIAGVWGYYMMSKAYANTSGLTSFPSNQYDLHADWGRASYDIRNRAFTGGYVRLPHHFSFNGFLMYQSSSPFNITVGNDLNGDTQFNDRPAFATDLTRASVYQTQWGTFDANPISGQSIIPINYGKGPGLVAMNTRLSRSFSFGPIVPDDSPAPADVAKDAKPAPTKPGAKPKKKEVERKYSLGFGVQAENVFNHPNFAPPVGVLGSSLFGQSTALSTTTQGNTSANRTIAFETFFRF